MTLKQMQAALAELLHVENQSRRRGGGTVDDEPSGPAEDAPATAACRRAAKAPR